MRFEQAVVASKNRAKISEVESILAEIGIVGAVVRDLEWPDVAETESSLRGNALLKARAVATATGLVAIADDTGLEVDALEGAPGVHSARYAGPSATDADNVAKLLDTMNGISERSARFRTSRRSTNSAAAR